MEEHNQMLKEKSKAYKKLAEALNDNYKSQLPKPGIKMKAPRKIRPT